uniref:Ig-like domain-containing protein n=1 Tax=Takifugu rubripes TaxID=31033 RepID=A0A674P7A2_TAKRU
QNGGRWVYFSTQVAEALCSIVSVFHTLAGEVPFRFPALTQSCVVIPCSFQQQENMLLTKGVWTKKSGRNIYHNAQSQVLDHFKGRTKILGRMDEGNCSLEIDDINAFDNGPFCFHAEHKKEKYRFNTSPDKPAMTQIPTEVDAGTIVTVSCSVTHTCSSHPPEFSWSVSNLTSEATHTLLPQGVWKSTSTITFMADGGDGEKSLTCTASYWRGRKQATTGQLTVKGQWMQFCLWGCHIFSLFTLFTAYVNRITGSLWERLSRYAQLYPKM